MEKKKHLEMGDSLWGRKQIIVEDISSKKFIWKIGVDE